MFYISQTTEPTNQPPNKIKIAALPTQMTSHRRDRGERDTLAVLRGQVWQCFTYIRCSADLRYSCVCVKDVEGLTVYACIACAFYLKVGSFVASLFVHTCIQGTLWLFR